MYHCLFLDGNAFLGLFWVCRLAETPGRGSGAALAAGRWDQPGLARSPAGQSPPLRAALSGSVGGGLRQPSSESQSGAWVGLSFVQSVSWFPWFLVETAVTGRGVMVLN